MALFEQKKFVLTNSQTGKREEFKPQKSPNVSYTRCFKRDAQKGATHVIA